MKRTAKYYFGVVGYVVGLLCLFSLGRTLVSVKTGLAADAAVLTGFIFFLLFGLGVVLGLSWLTSKSLDIEIKDDEEGDSA